MITDVPLPLQTSLKAHPTCPHRRRASLPPLTCPHRRRASLPPLHQSLLEEQFLGLGDLGAEVGGAALVRVMHRHQYLVALLDLPGRRAIMHP